MSSYIGVFQREFIRNNLVCRAPISRDNWNCYALSIFRNFMLLASSDNDKLMLMRQKCKRGFAHTLFAHAACSITFVFFLSVSHRHVWCAVVMGSCAHFFDALFNLDPELFCACRGEIFPKPVSTGVENDALLLSHIIGHVTSHTVLLTWTDIFTSKTLRYVLPYNLEVSFNFQLTFLQLNMITMFTV